MRDDARSCRETSLREAVRAPDALYPPRMGRTRRGCAVPALSAFVVSCAFAASNGGNRWPRAGMPERTTAPMAPSACVEVRVNPRCCNHQIRVTTTDAYRAREHERLMISAVPNASRFAKRARGVARLSH